MARPKATGETKSHQQHLLMTPSEVQAIDDWRFKNRIGSRGEAIRRLCQNGLVVHDDIGPALDETSDVVARIAAQHNNLWAMMMQIRGRHEHANPPLPPREWTAEEVIDRALDWSSDLVERSRVLYLDLLSLNNRVYSMSEPSTFAGARKEAERQKLEIESTIDEILWKHQEGENNRRLLAISDWMRAHPEIEGLYQKLSEEQKEEFLDRAVGHVREVADLAGTFSPEEEAKITRRNDEPFDFGAVADLAAASVLLYPADSNEDHARRVLAIFPTADPVMVEMMVVKAIDAAVNRDMSFPS
ncbi:hypothetical protein [Paradevosia shaoguanensis]|uniref:Uncharacterized protein n=1 Tax=Paradevosia shaoguanensis TaxID=1335043 RepID=A0AA41UDA0_9HYPH|nr:hypothetical protein [Paradevosia shaoguanensis]MCF1744707.1 hypothetical protein [Paradevosia shaoguanensis]MCI0129190.1 hypothetical protein [Paradevosia shaoguanensis]